MAAGLDVVFVGINPSVFSVERDIISRARAPLLALHFTFRAEARARAALAVKTLGPQHDRALLDYGIGFTDVVKRATPKASDLSSAELAAASRI